MNPSKNVLIALLALTSVAGGVVAWQQHQRALLASSPGASSDYNALLEKLAEAERSAADLESRLAALQAAAGQPTTSVLESTNSPDARRDRERESDRDNGPGVTRRAEMAALMNSPEVMKLIGTQQKAGLDARYADLFKSLKLNPAQIEAFKNLLLEKENARRDVMTASRENGLNPRQNPQEFRALLDQANAETDAAIVAAIGQQKFDEYKHFESTQSQRAAVNQLTKSLSYTNSPLSDTQSSQLVNLLTQNKPAPTHTDGRNVAAVPPGGTGPGVSMSRGTPLTDAVIAQAQSFLTPIQVDALRQQQAAQRAQQELNRIMREANQNARAATSAVSVPPATKP